MRAGSVQSRVSSEGRQSLNHLREAGSCCLRLGRVARVEGLLRLELLGVCLLLGVLSVETLRLLVALSPSTCEALLLLHLQIVLLLHTVFVTETAVVRVNMLNQLFHSFAGKFVLVMISARDTEM